MQTVKTEGPSSCREHGNRVMSTGLSSDCDVNRGKTASDAAEERRRSGRYLAVCLAFVLIFIASYHILLKQIPVLVGLLAPAIIMILYLLWLFYFAKKKRQAQTQVTIV